MPHKSSFTFTLQEAIRTVHMVHEALCNYYDMIIREHGEPGCTLPIITSEESLSFAPAGLHNAA